MDSYFLDEEESLEVEKLDLSRYYRACFKRWWVIALVALVVTIPWLLYLKSQPPMYEAKALIRFKNFAGNDIALAQSRTTELTSRSFAERVVAQLGLSLRVDKQGDQFINRSKVFSEFSTTRTPVSGQYVLRIKSDQTFSLSLLHEDGKSESVVKSGFVQDIVENFCIVNGLSFKLVPDYFNLPPEVKFKIRAFRSAVESFQSRIRVNWEDRAGTLMNLTLTDPDPIVVTEMTNKLAEIFIQESSGLKKESVQSRRKIFEEQLEKAAGELQASDIRLKQFKERNTTHLGMDQKKQASEVALLDKQKTNLEVTLNTLRELLQKKDEERLSMNSSDPNKLTLRIIMNQLASHAVFDENATMLVTRSQLGNFESNWKEMVSRTSSENYKAKQILQEILQEHRQVENIARQEIIRLEDALRRTVQDMAKVEYRIRQLPTQQQELSELVRENKVLERQYTELLAKTREAQIAEAVETEDIEILDSAIEPEFPTNRDKKQKAVFGGVFGLFLGFGLVVMIEFMNKTLKTADDVKKYLRVPVLGTIPQIDFEDTYDFQDSEKIKQIDQQLVTHDYSPTPIGEAYRSLRTNLMFTKDTGRTRTLVLTSNEPGDGKSFTAANLSITLAQLKSNTLLVDGDLRRGVLHNTFGVPKEPGFSNYLTDVVSLQNIIHETQIPNLSLITCGSLIPNPSELLGSHQMQRFLDEVRRKFDLVVFDTPPLNAATDAVVLGTQVDAVVLVIRAGKTDRDLARSKLELFSSVPAKVLGTVLNGTTADMAHPGYSYYHY
ncbi:polysaccharide biosynthesis tyrosine autokinase [candidate division KSB1 bacterium]|nr:polysaccharide biosynthesis tyrosine autokinase [candidate division KSB1 bacterium]